MSILGIRDSGQKIVGNGLVLNLDAAQLRSYPGSGTTWTDMSGNSNNGTLVNPSFNSGNGGNFVFNSSGTAYVNPVANYSTYLNFGATNAPFTLSVFFKLTVANAGSEVTAIVLSSNSSGNWDYGMWVEGANRLLVGTNAQNKIGNTSVSANVIYQGTVVSDSVNQYLYLNGVNDGTFAVTLSNNGSQSIIIGRRQDCCFFRGNVYNVQIYNRALSATEVRQNFNALKSRFGL